MKATRLLKEDHRQILRALNVLEQMAGRAERGEILAETDAEDILAFFHAFADRHHQGKEEAILFPALLRDPDQRHYKQLRHMIFEHNQERSLAVGLEEAIRTKKTRDFVFCACQLAERLRAHIEKEDRILFELADSVLSPAEDEEIAAAMEDFERQWQQRVLSGLLRRLDELESEYTRGSRAGTTACH